MNASDSTDLQNSNWTWTELFLGTFTAPMKTFEYLNTEGSKTKEEAEARATTAFFVVLFVHLAIGLSLSSIEHIAISSLWIFMSIFSGIILWIIFTYLLYLAANWLKVDDFSLAKSSVLTGWAHLPLCLYPSIHLLELGIGPIAAPISILPLAWFILLLLAAANSVLNVSYAKLLFGAFVVPPVVCLALFYWLYLIVSYATLKVLYLIV